MIRVSVSYHTPIQTPDSTSPEAQRLALASAIKKSQERQLFTPRGDAETFGFVASTL